ncbi:MAG: hypothetical protein AB7O26_00145 [Planctomycetaceae bacterium]
MGSAILVFLGMIGAAGVVLGTITSAFFAALAEDKRVFLAMPLFSVMWCVGIFQLLS